MRSSHLLILFFAFLLVFVIMNTPMTIVVPSSLSVHTSGTIWSGKLRQVPSRAGAVDIAYQASPFSLLMFELTGVWQMVATGLNAHGIVTTGLSGDIGIKDSSIRLNIAALQLSQPFVGDLDVQLDSLVLNQAGECLKGKGQAMSDVLLRSRDILNWQGPELTGPIRCDAEIIELVLSGRNNQAFVTLESKLSPDGNIDNKLSIESENPIIRAALAYQGFENRDNRFTLIERGRWR